ncbi:MAG: cobaltochelatase subunit CobN [Pirellulales bacterium]
MNPLVLSRCIVLAALLVGTSAWSHAAQSQPKDPVADVGFIGLHGGVYEQLNTHAKALGIQIHYFTDEDIHLGKADLQSVRLLCVQHVRQEDRDRYREIFKSISNTSPLKILAFQSSSADFLRETGAENYLIDDTHAASYYGNTNENLRRLLLYLGKTYLARDFTIESPEESEKQGFYHPDHSGLFSSIQEATVWLRSKRPLRADQPRLLIAVHSTHLFFQQPRVVDALIREAEKHGAIAIAGLDGRGSSFEKEAIDFAPNAVIHTCHSTDSVEFRSRLNVPHLHCIFIRKQSIDEWQKSKDGLSWSELAFHVTGQELIGAIEPQVGAGTTSGNGSSEAMEPIPDRITHLIKRSLSYAKLQSKKNSEKQVGIIYYDREMGKGELMRGSATGMHMNAPRSALHLLHQMAHHGYRVDPTPSSEEELLSWLVARGRQIGVWAPRELELLVQHGNPALIHEETYRKWYEAKVPLDRRQELEAKWGKPPGRFMVWEKEGSKYIVIPRIQLENVTLLPQPLRGELNGFETAAGQAHDKTTAPPHNYLATYFWLQEELQADAVIHFGTHGSEFALPGKPNGLSQRDWPDIILGSMPNFCPWIIENMVESSPVRRRTYGTLISHLPPPVLPTGLDEELETLHQTIDKWVSLEEGTLRDTFAKEITRQAVDLHLDRDLQWTLAPMQQLTDSEIEKLQEYLHDLQEQSAPTSLHTFGHPPPDELLVPYLVEMLRHTLLPAVQELQSESDTPFDARDPHNMQQTRDLAHRLLRSILIDQRSIDEAIQLGTGRSHRAASQSLSESVESAKSLYTQFQKTTDEVDHLLKGLDGLWVPPGPGNSPLRNPKAVPTGRNMYLLNPEEIPTRPSWELGVKLAKQYVENYTKQHGHAPTKVGFDLRSSATFRDYGVMESQILYLMGVEPIWDDRNLVHDVRLIPTNELNRPRIDVFIAVGNWYESNLPSRLPLWDKAIRLVTECSETTNLLYLNSVATERKLLQQGLNTERAKLLSKARMFGVAPGNESGRMLGYLLARSGDWESREDIADAYLASHKHVYTEGAWGEPAHQAYDETIQGTHTVIRSWSDHMTGPLASKYTWLHGGALSLAVERMTGKRPEFLLSDVRDADRATMIDSEEAVRREYRVRLFNRRWLTGMMKEGYAGADHMRVMVTNSFAWEVMRPGTVGQENWMEMKKILVDDRLRLGLRDWWERTNPYAMQDTLATMIESIRKGYWKADPATYRELVEEYAKNVQRHGFSGNITSGGNQALHTEVQRVLNEFLPDQQLQIAYQNRLNEDSPSSTDGSLTSVALSSSKETPSIKTVVDASSPAPQMDPIQAMSDSTLTNQSIKQDVVSSNVQGNSETIVTGIPLENPPPPKEVFLSTTPSLAWLGLICIGMFCIGFFVKK